MSSPDTVVLIQGFWVTPRSWEDRITRYEREGLRVLAGHSAGGLLVQLLLDRGHGAAGVAINSAPTEGVEAVPLSQIRSTFEVVKRPGDRHRAVGCSFAQWRYAFTDTFPEDEARRLYERLHVPAPGSVIRGSLFAGVQPGHQDNWVDYVRHYRSDTVTELKEFEGRSHLMPSQEGWEEVADCALEWAVSHARETTTA